MPNKCVVCRDNHCMYPAYDKDEIDALLEEIRSEEKFIIGQYTGNGETNKNIDLGFTPKLLIILSSETYYMQIISNKTEQTSIGEQQVNLNYYSNEDPLDNVVKANSITTSIIVTNGFRARNAAGSNTLNQGYTYIAIK